MTPSCLCCGRARRPTQECGFIWGTATIPTMCSTSRWIATATARCISKDYNQVLLADAYGGYNGVVAGNEITRAGCWAHLRRKIIEAEKAAPEIARQAIERVGALYRVERQAGDLTAAERLKLRQENSAPILLDLHEKLLVWKEQLVFKHQMAVANGYALTQWRETGL